MSFEDYDWSKIYLQILPKKLSAENIRRRYFCVNFSGGHSEIYGGGEKQGLELSCRYSGDKTDSGSA